MKISFSSGCFNLLRNRGRFARGSSFVLLSLSLAGVFVPRAHGVDRTEAASFLDIPVGGRAAALGASYSALASDAYAPVWNPAGLGFLRSDEFSGMHLSYLEDISYEFASFVHPLSPGRAVGVSAQYLSPGNIQSTDVNGSPLGTFTGHYAAYSAAYGRKFGDNLSVGLAGKIVDAKINDVSAQAYGFDAGGMYQATERLRLAAVIANVGSKLTFIDQHDPLPSAFRLGAAYNLVKNLDLTAEGDYRFSGLASGHIGAEWMPSPFISLRGGYRTDTLKGLSAAAGLSIGIGLHLFGHEFDYAWVPVDDLGSTQYFSLLLRFGAPREPSKTRQEQARAGTQEFSSKTEKFSLASLWQKDKQ